MRCGTPVRALNQRAGRRALAACLLVACSVVPRASRGQDRDTLAFAVAARALVAERDAPLARRGVGTGRASLRDLYGGAQPRPIWTTGGRPTAPALAVIAFLATVETRGLRPADYEASALGAEAATLAATGTAAEAPRLARFDVDLSRALMRLLAHLHAGRVDPGMLRFHLPETHLQIDLVRLALDVSEASDPTAAITATEPRYAGYALLESSLARYRLLAADTTLVLPRFPLMPVRPGDLLEDALALRRLLRALGDLRVADSVGDSLDARRYTPDLAAAIVRFQRRHALEPDGIIARATIRELRVPLALRVRQIELTLERWRWLPDTPPERYAVVNIPAFHLLVFEHDSLARQPVLEMSVIVGQAAGKRGTPVFAGTMEEVVFRPYWDVPLSIARQELIPQSRRQSGFFAREALEMVRGGDDDATVYAPSADNAARVEAGTLRLRQRPGPGNALGLAKFVFPNSHNVYLHGTPAQELFSRTRRDFSHGCIRVADPVALAALVLRDQDDWSRATIEAAMAGDRTRRVRIAHPVAVYILYATVVAGADGVVKFYPDLYGHDAMLARALRLTRRRAESRPQAAATY